MFKISYNIYLPTDAPFATASLTIDCKKLTLLEAEEDQYWVPSKYNR